MTREETLDGAKACVCQDREQEYGSPEDNFKLISNFWVHYITARWRSGNVPVGCFTAMDVAIMMALLKIARIATGTFKEDSFIDACGYIACAAELAKGE